MSFGLDTSVLIRLLIGEPAPLAEKAKARLIEAHHLRQSVVVSDLVIAETYFALKHHYEIASAEIRSALLTMLTSGLIQAETGSAALTVLTQKAGGKAGFVDRLILARYESDSLVTWTLDKAQSKIGRAIYIG